jgi:hypothetical protein
VKVVRLRFNILEHSHGKGLLTLPMICLGLMLTVASFLDAQTLGGTANPVLDITAAVPGSEPTPAVNTASTIDYKGKAKITKITVRTVVTGSQKFDLTVRAAVTSGHGSAVTVTLLNGMLAADFITDIPKNAGQSSPALTYTSAPQFSDGSGSDSHTVTYTQVNQ